MEQNQPASPIQKQDNMLFPVFGLFLGLALILASCTPAQVETPQQQPTIVPSAIPEIVQPVPTFTSSVPPVVETISIPASFTPVVEVTSTPASFTIELVEETSIATLVAVPVVQATRTSTPENLIFATATNPDTPIAPPPGAATPEPFYVDSVKSPTDQLTQTIIVYIGNGEEVTVTTEAGIFTARGDFNAYSAPAQVEITLLPNTVNHLEVRARVRIMDYGGYRYGGYTLSTTRDRQGNPLVIIQENAANP